MAHRTRSGKESSARTRAGIATLIAVLAGAAGCVSSGTERENTETSGVRGYPIVGTSQAISYDDKGEIADPAKGEPFYGQDSQQPGTAPAYLDNGDGTITDTVTGLMWVKDRGSTITWANASRGATADRTGGYSDWRMPTIKELYSLIRFDGVNGHDNMSTTGFQPFIDTGYFGFAYGSGKGQERVIDCQDWSATVYVSTTMNRQETVFGVNFADGRIKGYPMYDPASGGTIGKKLYIRYVRGNADYGKNDFIDNGDGTVTDRATKLMWAREDSGTGMDWQNALAWIEELNAGTYLGHDDWRMPDAKELQSIVDYGRSPATTDSPAIDTRYLSVTSITNEAGEKDYPYFWSSTILLDGGPTPSGVYIAFGRAIGYVRGSWIDVHGAGSQKSDILSGDPAKYPEGRGPQGDSVRIENFVRPVRDVD